MDLQKIIRHQRAFVTAREWNAFHTPKNLAAALSVEAAELLEIFQWFDRDAEKPENMDKETREQLREELADVFFYLVRLADVTGVDLEKAFWSKMKKNAKKYPVSLSKGHATKYNRLKAKHRKAKRKTKSRS